MGFKWLNIDYVVFDTKGKPQWKSSWKPWWTPLWTDLHPSPDWCRILFLDITGVVVEETQRMQYDGHNTRLGYIILSKACRAAVSMIDKGSIVA